MKLFTNVRKAVESYRSKQITSLDTACHKYPDKLCGDWCSLFTKGTNRLGQIYVVLGCKAFRDEILVSVVKD